MGANQTNGDTQKMNLVPDPLWHRNISFVKSALRILAGVGLITGNLIACGVLFILAEVLGILEELV